MSGTAENIWAMSDEKNHVNIAHEIAERLHEPTDSLEQLVELLKRAPSRDVVNSVSYFDIFFGMMRLKFTPIIESLYLQFLGISWNPIFIIFAR